MLPVGNVSTKLIREVRPKFLFNIRKIEVVYLHRNVRHPRAITLGLTLIETNRFCQGVVIIDGNGEDDYKDVETLLELDRQHSFRCGSCQIHLASCLQDGIGMRPRWVNFSSTRINLGV